MLKFWKIAPCLFAIIVDYMGLGLVYPVVTALFTDVHDTVFPTIQSLSSRDFYLGLSYLLYPLFMFFGASLLGDFSDNYGRKKVLIFALGGILVSFLLMSLGIAMHAIWVFLVGRALSGLMAGSQPLCMAAIADLSTPATKARNMSLVTLTNCIGLIFGPFIAGVFTNSYFLKIMGFSFPFFVAAFVALIGLILIIFLFEETFTVETKKRLDCLRPITIFVDAFKNHKVLLLVIAVFLQMLGFMLYYQTIGVYLRETLQYTSSKLGFFYGFMGLFFAAGVLIVIPFVLKRWKIESIALWGFFICGLFALATVFYKNEIYIWITVIPFAAANATGFTAIATLFSHSTNKKNQGWIMGVLAATVALSYVVSGFSTNLLPYISSAPIIAIGGAAGMLSGIVLFCYRTLYTKKLS